VDSFRSSQSRSSHRASFGMVSSSSIGTRASRNRAIWKEGAYDLPEFVSELLEVIASAKRRSWGSELRSTSGVERLPNGIGPDRQMPDARP
jgi:hypothetical protein